VSLNIGCGPHSVSFPQAQLFIRSWCLMVERFCSRYDHGHNLCHGMLQNEVVLSHKFLIFHYTHSRSWIIILGPSWTMLHRRLFILVLTNREPRSDKFNRIPYPRLEPPDSHIQPHLA
jgi:hypothetical protein